MATPYELLLGMSLLRDKQRQENQAINNTLKGAAFLRIRINKQEMLVLQDEIKELMPALSIAEITPRLDWLLGFTSYKGELLPVANLNKVPELLSEETPEQQLKLHNKPTKMFKILVTQGVEGLIGIHIDAVLGIQHYWLQSQPLDDADNPWYQAWINIENSHRQQETLPVLNIKKLIRYCHQQAH